MLSAGLQRFQAPKKLLLTIALSCSGSLQLQADPEQIYRVAMMRAGIVR